MDPDTPLCFRCEICDAPLGDEPCDCLDYYSDDTGEETDSD